MSPQLRSGSQRITRSHIHFFPGCETRERMNPRQAFKDRHREIKERETARKNLSVKNKEVILGGLDSLTFPQHIAVAMATTVLRVATRVCEREMWLGGRCEDKRWGRETHKKGWQKKVGDNVREREKKQHGEEKETEECKKKGTTRSGGGGGGGGGREGGGVTE